MTMSRRLLCSPFGINGLSRSYLNRYAPRVNLSTAAAYVDDKSRYVQKPDKPVPFKLGKHRSNALELIEQQAVIEVDGEMAICDGGGGALGHPIEYLALERPGEIKSCLYCGLKFKSKGHH